MIFTILCGTEQLDIGCPDVLPYVDKADKDMDSSVCVFSRIAELASVSVAPMLEAVKTASHYSLSDLTSQKEYKVIRKSITLLFLERGYFYLIYY